MTRDLFRTKSLDALLLEGSRHQLKRSLGSFDVVMLGIGAIIGASIVPRYFDAFVIFASAFGGAAMLMAGAHSLFPGVKMFDRASGGLVPAIVTIVLTLIGISWQFKNIAAAIRSTPLYGGISGTAVRDHHSAP